MKILGQSPLNHEYTDLFEDDMIAYREIPKYSAIKLL